MKVNNLAISILFIVCFSPAFVFAQKKSASQPDNSISSNNLQAIKSSAAYAELLLRKVELESDVESLLESYTEEFPKVKASRYELELTKKDLSRLLTQADASRLTSALGRLLVRKNEVETELWTLQNQYNKDHPEVKRAQRKVSSFQNAVKEILP